MLALPVPLHLVCACPAPLPLTLSVCLPCPPPPSLVPRRFDVRVVSEAQWVGGWSPGVPPSSLKVSIRATSVLEPTPPLAKDAGVCLSLCVCALVCGVRVADPPFSEVFVTQLVALGELLVPICSSSRTPCARNHVQSYR